MPVALGKTLRSARVRLGLSQSDVAKRAGIAPNHIARLESGEKSHPRFETVAKVAAVLGLSLDQLATKAELGEETGTAYKARQRAAIAQASLVQARRALRSALASIEAELGDKSPR